MNAKRMKKHMYAKKKLNPALSFVKMFTSC